MNLHNIIVDITENFAAKARLHPENTTPETLEALEFIESQAEWKRSSLMADVETMGQWVSIVSSNKELRELESLKGIEGRIGLWLQDTGGTLRDLNELLESLTDIVRELKERHNKN